MSVRPASAADIPELVRLREMLFERMLADHEGPRPATAEGWQEAFAAVMEDRLDDPDMAVLVVGAAPGRLAACGTGIIDRRLPGPFRINGLTGYILNMATDPLHRRRGHARAVMSALLAWFSSRGVRRVDLNATSDGVPLYREYGFREPAYPALSRLL